MKKLCPFIGEATPEDVASPKSNTAHAFVKLLNSSQYAVR